MLAYLPILLAADGPNYGYSWGLILLSVVLGMIVALKSSGRTSEVKRRGVD